MSRQPGVPFTQANFNYYCRSVGAHVLGRRLTPKELCNTFFTVTDNTWTQPWDINTSTTTHVLVPRVG
jgi:hypothetical protein